MNPVRTASTLARSCHPAPTVAVTCFTTVLGAAATVRFAIAAWALAGVAMLFTPWPGPLAAVLALPYIAAAAPYWSVTDERSSAANRGWRRFLWITYACGFLVTLLLIVFAIS